MTNPENHLGLLLIDFQDAFLQVIPDREQLLQRTCFAVEAANLLGCATIVTEQLPEKLGHTTAYLNEYLPDATPVIAKTAFSAMESEWLNEWIEENQIDHLLLLGIETPICIYQTAVQALGEELGITLLSDCIGERRPADREPALRQLLAMGAHILPAETVFYSLLGSSDHPHFRAFTQLVKKYDIVRG